MKRDIFIMPPMTNVVQETAEAEKQVKSEYIGGIHHDYLSTGELEQFVEHITQLRRSFMGAIETIEAPVGWRYALGVEGIDLSFRVGRLLDRIARNSMGEVKDDDIQFALMVRQLNAWLDLLNVMNNRILED